MYLSAIRGSHSGHRGSLAAMSKETLLACLFALLTWHLIMFAIRRVVLVFAMRKMSPDQVSDLVNPLHESLRDEQAFVDGWRSCETCNRITPQIDNEHIMHHYTFNDPQCDRSSGAT